MFPIRDENPTLHTSFVTFIIIAANVLTWIFIQGMGADTALVKSIIRFGLIPGELLGTAQAGTQVVLGSHYSYSIDAQPHIATLFTSMFMHGGWLHLIGNMWFLWVFGDNVEDSMGSVRFAFFYILCGLAAAAAQLYASPHSTVPMVGASGAISGVMGAYALLYPMARVHMLIFLGIFFTRIIIPAYLMLGYWFLLQAFSALPATGGHDSGVAFAAHIGGFIAGITLIFLFRKKERVMEKRAKSRWQGIKQR
jgi:membrane associated rhomboid family serine protease